MSPRSASQPRPPPGPSEPPRDVTWEVLSDHLNDLVVMADVSSTIFYVSPACRMLGYAQHEMIGRGPDDFVHPDDLAHFTDNTLQLFVPAGAGPAPGREHRVRCKDGSWLWMEGNPKLIRDGGGAPIGIINVFRDVTARRAAETALEDSERRYRLMAEHATDMISQTAVANGRITYLSPSVERVTGYRADELVGQRMQDFVHPDDRAMFMAAFVDLVAGRRECGRAIRFRAQHKDGRWLWLESNPRLIRDEDGTPSDIVDMTRDVGAQQALKEQLAQALAEAERAADAKGEFLSNMSHEIRTPLTAVLGFTGLLAERRDLDPVARGYVDRVAGAGRALLAIVNDVLDFSKLEAGVVTLSPRSTAAAALISEVVEMFEAQAEEKGLALTFEAAKAAPAHVRLDGDRLRQILVNLIGNAVKFTDRGEVRVRARYDAGAGRITIEVSDTGPGIAAAAREKLFERFSQVDGSSTRAKGGTGLGLAISRKLAEAMGGEITVKSRVGRGSTFRVDLAAPVAPDLPVLDEAGPSADALEGVRVLVADDNAINRELARAILEPMGVEISEAEDGLAALEAARRAPVDLILMDMRMPRMNGLEAATAIRLTPGPNQDIPILAFSADSDVTGDTSALGPFDGRVSKPVSPATLIAAVVSAMSEMLEPDMEGVAHVHG